MKRNSPADFAGNEIQNVLLQNLAADPAALGNGQIYYLTDGRVRVRIGGAFQTVATLADLTAGGISANIVDAKGDLIVGTADNTVQRKAAGANGTFLSPNSALSDGLEYRNLVDGDIPAAIMRDAEHTVASHQEIIATSDLTDWPRTAALDLNGQKLTGLDVGVASTDAVTLGQAQALLDGLTNKATVRLASTGNVNVASAPSAVDGVNLANGDRVLLKDQTTGSQNGIRIFTAAGAALARATDADISAEVKPGLYVFVSEGTANGNKGFQLFTDGPIVLDTTTLDFQQVSAAGQIVAGAGVTKTGDTIDVGQGVGIIVNANDVAVDVGLVARYKKFIIGDASATSFTCAHNLNNTSAALAALILASTGKAEEVDWTSTDANTITVGPFLTAPALNAYRVLIVG